MVFSALYNEKLSKLIAGLQAAGIVPPDVCRVIIDIDYDRGRLARVYYECLADERMFDLDLLTMLKEAKDDGMLEVIPAAKPADELSAARTKIVEQAKRIAEQLKRIEELEDQLDESDPGNYG